MQKNVSGQKLSVYVFDSTTNFPKTGDAANLTAYVNKDYGGVTVLSDTSATEVDATNAKGFYVFDLTQSETNADALLFSAKSSTANMVVLCIPAVVFTTPANFTVTSIDSSGRVDLAKIAGTSQTARDIGASVLLSSGTGTGQLDITSGVVKSNSTQLAGQTVTASAGVTFPSSVASPTNITAGTITTVTTLTNAPSDSSGVTTLLSRLSATRAGYLDNLSAGAVALETSLQGLITTIGASAAGVASAVWSAATRVLTAGTNIVLAKGTGVTGFNDLDASGVRNAVGLASANLDTQLAALPTDADVQTAAAAALTAAEPLDANLVQIEGSSLNAADVTLKSLSLVNSDGVALYVKSEDSYFPAVKLETDDRTQTTLRVNGAVVIEGTGRFEDGGHSPLEIVNESVGPAVAIWSSFWNESDSEAVLIQAGGTKPVVRIEQVGSGTGSALKLASNGNGPALEIDGGSYISAQAGHAVEIKTLDSEAAAVLIDGDANQSNLVVYGGLYLSGTGGGEAGNAPLTVLNYGDGPAANVYTAFWENADTSAVSIVAGGSAPTVVVENINGGTGPAVSWQGGDGAPGLLVQGGDAATRHIDSADLNALYDTVLVSTPEPTAIPAADASLADKISLVSALGRNILTSDGSTGERTLYADDDTTPIGSATDTDTGGETGTLTRGKLS